MIYGRWGQTVTIKRHATLADVRALEFRKPDKADKANLANGCYIIVEDSGQERLYALAFLRADDGSVEITRAIEALGPAPTT